MTLRFERHQWALILGGSSRFGLATARKVAHHGMSSAGHQVAWPGGAAVAAAKCALQSVSRAIALECAPHGLRANVIQAGVTDSPALRLIPGSAHMKAAASLRNPFGRLTTAAEVADFICLMCTDEARWVNGAILRVDGGEHISG